MCWQLQVRGLENNGLSPNSGMVCICSFFFFFSPYVFKICHANFQALKWLIVLGLKGQALISELGGRGGESEPNINFGTLGQFDVGGTPPCKCIVTQNRGVGRDGSS